MTSPANLVVSQEVGSHGRPNNRNRVILKGCRQRLDSRVMKIGKSM